MHCGWSSKAFGQTTILRGAISRMIFCKVIREFYMVLWQKSSYLRCRYVGLWTYRVGRLVGRFVGRFVGRYRERRTPWSGLINHLAAGH